MISQECKFYQATTALTKSLLAWILHSVPSKTWPTTCLSLTSSSASLPHKPSLGYFLNFCALFQLSTLHKVLLCLGCLLSGSLVLTFLASNKIVSGLFIQKTTAITPKVLLSVTPLTLHFNCFTVILAMPLYFQDSFISTIVSQQFIVTDTQ